MNFKKLFLNHCYIKGLEINNEQIKIVELISKFYQDNYKNSFLLNIFSKNKKKIGFYLYGEVGVGKTMILDLFYENFKKSKQRLHFNEFMIDFHDFVFQNNMNKKKILLMNLSLD